MRRRDILIGLGVSLLLVLGAFYFGSPLPDGMEATVERLAGHVETNGAPGWFIAALLPERLRSGAGLLALGLAGFWLVYGVSVCLGRLLSAGAKGDKAE